MMVAINVHICDQRRSYVAKFSTQDQAIAFIERRSATHAFSEIESAPIPDTDEWNRLYATLYPTCEHGMSESGCYGPDHYMSAAQEQAMNWDYSDAPAGF